MSGYRPPPGSIPTLEVPDLADVRRLRSMGERARAWSRPDAANALARTVLAAGDGG